MATTLEHFTHFAVDNAGLERMLRLAQSVTQILIAYPLLLSTLLPNKPAVFYTSVLTTVIAVQSRINLVRRTMRLFRFLESFQTGWALWNVPNKDLTTWLGVWTKTALGTFGMLESVTLLDLVGLDGLEIFGMQKTKEMNQQAQMFWLLALGGSALSSALKLFASPVLDDKPSSTEKIDKSGTPENDVLVKVPSPASAKESGQLMTKFITDLLDMSIPATAVGLAHFDGGLVGMAMLITTLTTGYDVWKRCGAEVQKKKA